jgi:hypothetical protein
MSGGSIWASRKSQCCFWIAGGLLSYLTKWLLTLQLFINSNDTKKKLRLILHSLSECECAEWTFRIRAIVSVISAHWLAGWLVDWLVGWFNNIQLTQLTYYTIVIQLTNSILLFLPIKSGYRLSMIPWWCLATIFAVSIEIERVSLGVATNQIRKVNQAFPFACWKKKMTNVQ